MFSKDFDTAEKNRILETAKQKLLGNDFYLVHETGIYSIYRKNYLNDCEIILSKKDLSMHCSYLGKYSNLDKKCHFLQDWFDLIHMNYRLAKTIFLAEFEKDGDADDPDIIEGFGI